MVPAISPVNFFFFALYHRSLLNFHLSAVISKKAGHNFSTSLASVFKLLLFLYVFCEYK